MKIAFCTCVQIGLSCIEAVYSIGGKFDLLITLDDHRAKSKSGRIYLDEVAGKSNVPLVKIKHINDQAVIDALIEHDIDWLFIIGWSQIASKEVIETPNMGAVGAHPTLLPIGRGRAAIPWAIIKGLDRTGVSFFKMDEGVDTGEILAQYTIPLDSSTTSTALYGEVNQAHIDLIKQIWPDILSHRLSGTPQDENKATYWNGRTPQDGRIHAMMSVMEVDRLVRATTRPYPGAFVENGGAKSIIWAGTTQPTMSAIPIPCEDGTYYATEVEDC